MNRAVAASPEVVRTIAELKRKIAEYRGRAGEPGTVGFVPTMGYLHEGHASLIRRSAEENGLTVISIFVNPLQFGPNEDFERYPRDEERDRAVAAEAGANVIFMPSVEEMYPRPMRTAVSVRGVTERLCGASRPGHFDGVAAVVAKLLNIVAPDRAYFGLKDAQQVAVVSRMAEDLNLAAEIVPCPIVRAPDGLALSSRNVYLNEEERRQALILSQTLKLVPEWAESGATAPELVDRIKRRLGTQPLADIDYVEAVSYPDLEPFSEDLPLNRAEERILVALAVRFGKTRLIDNVLLERPRKERS